MIKASTDVGLPIGQLASFSELLLLSDFAAVIIVPSLMIFVGVGLSLVIIGAFQLGSRSYSSLTRPSDTNVLTQKGVYRYIRHPVYLGMLIVSSAFLLSHFTIQTGLAYFLLMLFTNIRADLEEGLLEERYPEYSAYKVNTRRYLPLIY